MPADLTIFAAKDLVFIAVVLAALVLAVRLWPRPRLALMRWAVAAVLVLLISYLLAVIGGAVYNDPRPFTTSHVRPLIAHAADNGFPSDHALLAAALVALVALVDVWWALPFVVLALLIDWARVGAGIHHVTDVIGASVFVAVALIVAAAVTPLLLRALTPRLPASWRTRPLLARGRAEGRARRA